MAHRMLVGIEAIPNGTDLNDIEKSGRYYSPSSTTTATLRNCPSGITTGFLLDVAVTSSSGGSQMIRPYGTGGGSATYIRSRYSGGWMGWYKYTGVAVSSGGGSS